MKEAIANRSGLADLSISPIIMNTAHRTSVKNFFNSFLGNTQRWKVTRLASGLCSEGRAGCTLIEGSLA